jgi:sec-independent protein translocase protein TatA
MRLGIPELILILAIVLLLFGTSRLAGLGKGLGQAIRGFKNEVDSKDDQHDGK